MRLLVKAALVKEQQQPVELEAAADDSAGPVGRWFSANLDLKSVLMVLSLVFGMIGGYFALQYGQTRADAQIAANASAIKAASDRFEKQVVTRQEYEDKMRDLSERMRGLEAQQQALYSALLNRALVGAK